MLVSAQHMLCIACTDAEFGKTHCWGTRRVHMRHFCVNYYSFYVVIHTLKPSRVPFLPSLSSYTLTHSLPPSLSPSLSHSLPLSLPPSLSHSLTPSLTPSLSPSLPPSLPPPLTRCPDVAEVTETTQVRPALCSTRLRGHARHY